MTRASVCVLSVFFTAAGTAAAEPARHPLDPLTDGEITAVVSVLKEAGHADESTRYPLVTLAEPPKAEVLKWRAGEPVPRRAFAVVKQGPDTFEAVVDLTSPKLVSWREVKGVQPSVLLEEFVGAGEIVKADPKWQAAMRRRGYTDFESIICLPATSGYYALPDEEGRRVMRLICFDRKGTQNFWGRPIEGLVPVVDLNRREVMKLIDTAVVPVPQTPVDYDEKAVGAPRAQTPLVCEQPQGPDFRVNGSEVVFQKWSFHVRIDPRLGPVVSLVRYDDGGRQRSVLYEGSLSEIFVPYQDTDQNWYFRTYLDPGEYGLGKLAGVLLAGVDCPKNASFLGDWLADDKGVPQQRAQIACLFERQTGDPVWRHYDLIADTTDGRASRELVLRMIAAVGNYDYVFDWVFQQDGTIKVIVGATGIPEVKAVKSRPRVHSEPGPS